VGNLYTTIGSARCSSLACCVSLYVFFAIKLMYKY